LERRDGHAKVVLNETPRVGRGAAAEYEDGRRDSRPAQLLALVHADYAKAPGAGFDRYAADGDGAVAVRVALDDGKQLRLGGVLLQRLYVGRDAVEVYLSPDSQPCAKRRLTR
jgi:hypothetical protein